MALAYATLLVMTIYWHFFIVRSLGDWNIRHRDYLSHHSHNIQK